MNFKTIKLLSFCFLLTFICMLASYAQETSGTQGWYTFSPENDYSKHSLIGLDDWNTKPAGKYGRITAVEDKLIYNGQEIKLWGLNNCYGACKPTKESAEKHAAFYRRYGINAIRLHKYADGFGGSGIQSKDSFVEFDPEGLDRMDYYIHV